MEQSGVALPLMLIKYLNRNGLYKLSMKEVSAAFFVQNVWYNVGM
jgi:hypothetical protein